MLQCDHQLFLQAENTLLGFRDHCAHRYRVSFANNPFDFHQRRHHFKSVHLGTNFLRENLSVKQILQEEPISKM